MKNFFKNNKAGFTLIEMMFGVAIFVVIAIALTYMSRNLWIYNSFVSASLNNADVVRKSLKTMTAEIRTASTANTGAYAIAAASTTSFTFYSDINDDGLKDRVRYFINGSQLQKGVIKPTGSPLTYIAGNEVVTTLIPNVTSSTAFSYYDKNYDGTTAALSPVVISSIRLVKITITLDKDPNRAPNSTTFSTQVSLRNLKDNL